MKITQKNTWVGIPLIIAGLMIWLVVLASLFTKAQAKWIDIVHSGGSFPSVVAGLILSVITGAIVGYLVAFGFAISAQKDTFDSQHTFVEFKLKEALLHMNNLFVVGGFIVANFIVFMVWRNNL